LRSIDNVRTAVTVVTLGVCGPGSKTDISPNMSDGPMIASRFSWPSAERWPILTLPEIIMLPVAGLTLGEDGVPAWEVDGLQLLGQRGDCTVFDSLEYPGSG
jgi:hypothetical protein